MSDQQSLPFSVFVCIKVANVCSCQTTGSREISSIARGAQDESRHCHWRTHDYFQLKKKKVCRHTMLTTLIYLQILFCGGWVWLRLQNVCTHLPWAPTGLATYLPQVGMTAGDFAADKKVSFIIWHVKSNQWHQKCLLLVLLQFYCTDGKWAKHYKMIGQKTTTMVYGFMERKKGKKIWTFFLSFFLGGKLLLN